MLFAAANVLAILFLYRLWGTPWRALLFHDAALAAYRPLARLCGRVFDHDDR